MQIDAQGTKNLIVNMMLGKKKHIPIPLHFEIG
jgi:hypothetical protein